MSVPSTAARRIALQRSAALSSWGVPSLVKPTDAVLRAAVESGSAPNAEKGWEMFEKMGNPRFWVAPMVNQSDIPFRELTRRYGAQGFYTQMFGPTSIKNNASYRHMCISDPDIVGGPKSVKLEADRPKWEKWSRSRAEVCAALPTPKLATPWSSGNGDLPDGSVENVSQLPGIPGTPNTDPLEHWFVPVEGAPAPTAEELNRPPVIMQFNANGVGQIEEALTCIPEGTYSMVDLNLGCPQGIAKAKNDKTGKCLRLPYGAYLGKDHKPEVYKIVRSAAEAGIPISVKIRLQYTMEETLEYARELAKAGAWLIGVHGRNVDQNKDRAGSADWDAISTIAKELPIPVIANGNIRTFEDAVECLKHTGCAGVMSAEGILNNPALFSPPEVVPSTAVDTVALMAEYLALCNQIKTPDLLSGSSATNSCVKVARRHLYFMAGGLLQSHPWLAKTLWSGKTMKDMEELVQGAWVRLVEEEGKGGPTRLRNIPSEPLKTTLRATEASKAAEGLLTEEEERLYRERMTAKRVARKLRKAQSKAAYKAAKVRRKKEGLARDLIEKAKQQKAKQERLAERARAKEDQKAVVPVDGEVPPTKRTPQTDPPEATTDKC